MELENKITVESQDNAVEIRKKKGGRPKGKTDSAACKVTLYLTEDEYEMLTEFAKTAWHTFSYSGAGRYLILKGLMEWQKKGKRKVV